MAPTLASEELGLIGGQPSSSRSTSQPGGRPCFPSAPFPPLCSWSPTRTTLREALGRSRQSALASTRNSTDSLSTHTNRAAESPPWCGTSRFPCTSCPLDRRLPTVALLPRQAHSQGLARPTGRA